MSSRNGKIARLPLQLRERMNVRISEGDTLKRILDWLKLSEEQASDASAADSETPTASPHQPPPDAAAKLTSDPRVQHSTAQKAGGSPSNPAAGARPGSSKASPPTDALSRIASAPCAASE